MASTRQTGCKVNLRAAGPSDEMVALMKTGQYDTGKAAPARTSWATVSRVLREPLEGHGP
ncbi:hypothetical protein P3T27_006074 [Kitasatospora sp. MAA19]|uniref:hypothetical protein n=1 Tax=Kitasatospora sp. MAA19 TaxID=3035090 RepID=UPI002475AC3E|nr:hypothetical protein [Kitasatospora sp. MAA19]MDH6709328.1 hypothetical protein [Kitasatospora sp. MAA19]